MRLTISRFIDYDFETTEPPYPIKWDDTYFVKEVLNKHVQNNKGVDCITATIHQNDPTLWLIEATDYREVTLDAATNLADEFVQKVRDTLAGLVISTLTTETFPETEKAPSLALMSGHKVRLVAHLEGNPWPNHALKYQVTKLDKIKQKLKLIDHQVVVGPALSLQHHPLPFSVVLKEVPQNV
jgi:hypothetical protein